MSQNWHQFLVSQGYNQNDLNEYVIDSNDNSDLFSLCPVTQFGLIQVSGSDAKILLQGQVTCNINDISNGQSSFGAFCNPKGRTLSTFLIWQQNDDYFLLLPLLLVSTIINRLKLFILRSKVTISDVSDDYVQWGLMCHSNSEESLPFLSNKTWEMASDDDAIIIKVPSTHQRFIVVSPVINAQAIWLGLQKKVTTTLRSSNYWQQQDLIEGIPWVAPETTELFIPQAINVDNLDGISYTKGCYTGQEIVARTHYLGKIKRKLIHGTLTSGSDPKPGEPVHFISDNKTNAGTILNVVRFQKRCYLTMVLKEEASGLAKQQFETANGSIVEIK